MPGGFDLRQTDMAVPDAQTWCMQNAKCQGFTFDGSKFEGGNIMALQQIFFKGSSEWHAGGTWLSYVKKTAAPTPAPKRVLPQPTAEMLKHRAGFTAEYWRSHYAPLPTLAPTRNVTLAPPGGPSDDDNAFDTEDEIPEKNGSDGDDDLGLLNQAGLR
jgi:hypothetical protein